MKKNNTYDYIKIKMIDNRTKNTKKLNLQELLTMLNDKFRCYWFELERADSEKTIEEKLELCEKKYKMQQVNLTTKRRNTEKHFADMKEIIFELCEYALENCPSDRVVERVENIKKIIKKAGLFI